MDRPIGSLRPTLLVLSIPMVPSLTPKVAISLAALALAGLIALAGAGGAQAAKRGVVEVDQVTVGAPGNPSVSIVPFTATLVLTGLCCTVLLGCA